MSGAVQEDSWTKPRVLADNPPPEIITISDDDIDVCAEEQVIPLAVFPLKAEEDEERPKEPYQGNEEYFGDFKCPGCKTEWWTAISGPDKWAECTNCHIIVDPHKRGPPKRKGLSPYQGNEPCFGEFICLECNHNWWSATSMADMGEECPICHINAYPHKQRPLEKPGRFNVSVQ